MLVHVCKRENIGLALNTKYYYTQVSYFLTITPKLSKIHIRINPAYNFILASHKRINLQVGMHLTLGLYVGESYPQLVRCDNFSHISCHSYTGH